MHAVLGAHFVVILFRFGIVLFSFCICSSDLEPPCFLVGRNEAIKSRCSLKNVMGHLEKVINRKNKPWGFICFLIVHQCVAFILQNPENAVLLLPPEVMRAFTDGPENMIWWDTVSCGNHLSQNACSCPCTVVFSYVDTTVLDKLDHSNDLVTRKTKSPAEHPSTVRFL